MTGKKVTIQIAIYFFLLVLAVFTLFPVLYAVLGAFKTNAEVTLGGTIIPRTWIFSNFPEAWNNANFARYTLNTLYTCVFTTIGSIIVASMSGFVVARKTFWGKKLLMGTILATMFLSVGAITLRPLYVLMLRLGLHRSLWSIILIQIATSQGANIFLVSRFVTAVPKELDEAAYIDGADLFQIYRMIVLPLITPILGVVGLFSFRYSWNDYVLPSIFTMTRESMRTLTVGVVSLRYGDSAAAQWNLMLAGASIAIIPMLIVYLIANRQFMSGLTAGAVKG